MGRFDVEPATLPYRRWVGLRQR